MRFSCGCCSHETENPTVRLGALKHVGVAVHATCVCRLLQLQIADKAKARALQQASGGLTAEERALNRTLLGRAAVTLGFA